MANISTSNITQKWADNGYWNSETDRTIYAGYATSTNINYVTRIRILMPGNGVSAQFKIAYKHDGSLNGKQLKYKITKEEQDGTYGRANASTAGDGTLTIAASSGFFTINYTGSFTAGSYLYIYLWTGGSTSVYTLCNILGPSNHTATYTEGTASDCAISGSTIGSAVNFTISADNSSFTHTITASFGSYVYNIATKTASKSVTWTPPLADLAGLIPNGIEITGSVTCSTYNGSTFIGSNTYNLKLSLPASVVPTLDASKISVSPVSNNAAANSWGAYVQNYSMAKATVASGAAAGVYGSTIKKTELVYAGQAFASLQTGILTTAGNVTFTVRVTDSRGRTASVGFSAYINPYIEPYLDAYTVYRCNAQGVQSNDGMYVYANATPIWSSVNGKNSVTLTVEVRNVADNSIATFTMDAYTDIISAGLSPNSTYRVTITIRDILGNYNDGQIVLPATSVVDFTIMKGHVKKAALFKYPEKDGFEVPAPIYADRIELGGISSPTIFHARVTDDGVHMYAVLPNGEEEWVNPPMLSGVEYRTVERFNGKAVYTKLANFGALPNATASYVSVCGEQTTAVDCAFTYYNTENGLSYTGDIIEVDAAYFASYGSAVIKTNTDARKFTATVVVKYTKD